MLHIRNGISLRSKRSGRSLLRRLELNGRERVISSYTWKYYLGFFFYHANVLLARHVILFSEPARIA